jgi:ATP-dependent Clp protease ATP-binding subunit ClpA
VGRDEQALLLNLETLLHQRVVGQEPAVEAVARALRRARAGVRDEGRPIGNFIFLGPSGVGKTELAKALAETLFGDEAAMHRLDMGEYYGPHCVARLIGAPPGYVGYEGGGQLTEAVRRRPHSVILFDEIEKADPKVFDTLLQVLDDGRLTDGQGRTVDFRQTLIIMTSNVGSRRILREGVVAAKETVLHELQTNSGFRPEFLNRMDEIIFFEALTSDDLREITEMEFAKLRARMRERNGIALQLTEEARALIIERGYDAASGAREIQRTMQDLIADRLAPLILARKATSGDTLWIERDGDQITIRSSRTEEP